MSATTPRARMFAGPNGSGKSELKKYLPQPLLGVYLNPDEIEQSIRKQGELDFSTYAVTACKPEEALNFIRTSLLLACAGHLGSRNITVADLSVILAGQATR